VVFKDYFSKKNYTTAESVTILLSKNPITNKDKINVCINSDTTLNVKIFINGVHLWWWRWCVDVVVVDQHQKYLQNLLPNWNKPQPLAMKEDIDMEQHDTHRRHQLEEICYDLTVFTIHVSLFKKKLV
jgi:hypothetical protein